MTDKNGPEQNSDKDFVSSSAFQKSINKTRRKQFILYILISLITITVSMIVIFSGSRYLIDKKIQKEDRKLTELYIESNIGAGILEYSTMYEHDLFSSTSKTTFYKKIGDRKIVWDIVTKKYPIFGNVETTDLGSGRVELNHFNEEANRVIRYNQLNNERFIDFYDPSTEYSYLPQELDIATGLESENKLIEVALSFYEPMELGQLGEVLGYENVDWLWEHSPLQKQDQSPNLEKDTNKVINAQNAKGFPVSERSPYFENSFIDSKIIGAIISGTPKELERFQELDIIRASVIGVTIDKY
ncbi:hypothetical protein ACFSTA_20110 [Ornithinibacillus salinisoli]|uniref:Sigma factor regulator C-terminal domain-containing protein n=1 Tax=Ornithinibacillus salinisoli TaxID=1848459 RepID=A0ABW4W4U3_9BACI